MQNIAGLPAARIEEVTRSELARARIAATDVLPPAPTHAGVGGRLGHLALRRGWRYWIVEGLVPLAVAEAIYADPAARTDVRTAGHAAGPPPREWAVWLDPDGRRVLPRSEEAELLRSAAGDNKPFADIATAVIAESVFADDPAAHPEVMGYVDGYHIDSELGLRVFADALYAAGLVGDDLPPAHARVKAAAERQARTTLAGVTAYSKPSAV